jgi:hypothetical protein
LLNVTDVANDAAVVAVAPVVKTKILRAQHANAEAPNADTPEIASLVMMSVVVEQCADARAPNAQDVVLFCKNFK